MTTTATPFRAFVREPFDFALAQPHQMLISSASVAIVAAEAATLIPFPANIALAIGAEWAYLRGLISGAGVKTRWAAALNWSAILLVFGYGSLWGFRGFHLIPATPPAWAAVLLTLIHILCIGAVTICSAMLHRAGMDAQAAAQRARQQLADERERRMQAERDRIALEDESERLKIERWRVVQLAKREVAAQPSPQPDQRDAAQPARNQVIYDGVAYPSIQAAADAHGISRQAMSKRLRRNQKD